MKSGIPKFWVWDVVDNIAKNVSAYCNYSWDIIATNLLLPCKKKKEAAPEPSTNTRTIEELSQEEGNSVKMTVPEESQVFKAVHKEEAIQYNLYSKYRLSADIQQTIKGKASLPEYPTFLSHQVHPITLNRPCSHGLE